MNNRIFELANQVLPRETDLIEGDPKVYAYFFSSHELVQFAELIVKECAYIVENSPWQLNRGYKAVDQANLVKQHFGAV
jgi:hypothetical protein